MPEREMDWRVATPDPAAVAVLARALHLPMMIAQILVNRNLGEPDAAARFLNPSLDHLRDPGCLPDVDKAVDRLAHALLRKERIFVHGDYDVDGVTASALCLRALSGLGANVEGYVPRRTDGYDLQIAGVERAREAGATLILTADCGVNAVGAVARAGELGMDVIVTDHHRPGPHLPDAVAVVNPYRDGCNAPFKHLCGAGVAFKVLDALVARVMPRHRESFRLSCLDLVALGTVADVTPLVDENRVLVAHGLRALARGKKPGIRALLLSTDLWGKTLSAQNVSWKLGPRLNAAGRMEDAALAYRLLITKDPSEAEQLAVQLTALVEKSREETRRVTTEAMADALLPEHAERRVLVLTRESWGKGVIGIAASRIVEQCRRPVILLSYDPQNDHWHGSARSYGEFNLHTALHGCAHLLHRFGGHSRAAGVSVSTANLAAFRERMHELAADFVSLVPAIPYLDVDAEVEGDWTVERVEQVEQLAPFGCENPEPVFVTRGVTALAPRRMGGDGSHFRMDARLPGLPAPVKAISFGGGDWADRLTSGDEVDIAYTPKINVWNGGVRVELMLRDIQAVQ